MGHGPAVWTSEQEGPPGTPPPPSHDPPHPEELQPIRDKQTDAEVENEELAVMVSTVCVCVCART